MSDIILKKTSPSALTFRIRNFEGVDVALECPVMVYSIPESPDTEAMGMKVEGNTSTLNISWTLVDESVTCVDELTGGSSILTADSQMNFLLGTFQPISIEDAYEIKLLKADNSTVFFTRTGTISKMSVSKSGDSPITWNANISFATGAMLAASDDVETNSG